jgi:hypothetical protein
MVKGEREIDSEIENTLYLFFAEGMAIKALGGASSLMDLSPVPTTPPPSSTP